MALVPDQRIPESLGLGTRALSRCLLIFAQDSAADCELCSQLASARQEVLLHQWDKSGLAVGIAIEFGGPPSPHQPTWRSATRGVSLLEIGCSVFSIGRPRGCVGPSPQSDQSLSPRKEVP